MDGPRFDDLARSISDSGAGSRRAFLRTLAVGVAGLAGVRAFETVEARSGRQRKRRDNDKLRTNRYGCVDVGKPCRGRNGLCCSGRCEGKNPKPGERDKSRCVARNEATCQAGQNYCAEPVPCGTGGYCFQTTGKASFCGDAAVCDCAGCRRDKDCQARFGPGAACAVCESDCNGVNGSKGTACVPAAALISGQA